MVTARHIFVNPDSPLKSQKCPLLWQMRIGVKRKACSYVLGRVSKSMVFQTSFRPCFVLAEKRMGKVA